MNQNRKNKIKDEVLKLLCQSHTHHLPIDLDNSMYALNIKSRSFTELRSRGVPFDKDDNGYTHYRLSKAGIQYLIIYNDEQSFERMRWTIAHELGHIVLGHIIGGAHNSNIEEEANYFAKELLMPIQVLDKLNARTITQIMHICGVSRTAAAIRVRDFERRDWYKLKHGDTEHDKQFLAQFSKMYPAEAAKKFYVDARNIGKLINLDAHRGALQRIASGIS